MSLITLTDFITCQNKELSAESIFKSLIDVSSSGKTYLRTSDSILSSDNTVSGTFTSAALVTVTLGGVSHIALLVTHNFGTCLLYTSPSPRD